MPLKVRKEPAVFRGAGARRPEGGREPGDPHTWSPADRGAQTLGAVAMSLAAAPLGLIATSGPAVLAAGTWVSPEGPEPGRKITGGPHPGEKQGRLGLCKVNS